MSPDTVGHTVGHTGHISDSLDVLSMSRCVPGHFGHAGHKRSNRTLRTQARTTLLNRGNVAKNESWPPTGGVGPVGVVIAEHQQLLGGEEEEEDACSSPLWSGVED